MDTKMESQKKYDAKYDVVKCCLSLLVVAIHTRLYPMVLYPWLRIAVPLFFMTSSYFLFSRLSNASATEQKAVIKKFVLRNVQLYACWFVILLPITLYVRWRQYFANGLIRNILNITRSILLSDSFLASWFIPALVIGVLIIYILSKWLQKNYWIFPIALFAFCVVTVQSSYKSVIAGTVVAEAINKYVSIVAGLEWSFPAALFWVFMGKLFAEGKFCFRWNWLLLGLIICSTASLFFEWKYVISLDGSYNNDSYFALAPLCIFLFAGIQKIKPIFWNNSVYCKRLSTVVYVAHASITPVIKKILEWVFHIESAPIVFFGTVLCCVLAYICIELLNKKYAEYRIGKVLKMLY